MSLRRRVGARNGPPLSANRRAGKAAGGAGMFRRRRAQRSPAHLERRSAGRRRPRKSPVDMPPGFLWQTGWPAGSVRQENRMTDPSGSAASSTDVIPAVIPAGHAAPSADGEREGAPPPTGLGGLSLAALGIVFGDIGTSPVYTFRECFNPERGLALEPQNVLGVLSLIVWALILVVARQIRSADHARRQSGRGRDPGLAGARPGGDAQPPVAQPARPARHRRRCALLRRQHDHPGDFRAERDRRDRGRDARR